MTSIVVAFFSSLLMATLLTPLVLKVATRRGLFDAPSDRKVHSRLVPRLGGIAIVIGFFVPVTGLLFVDAGMTIQLTQSEPQLVGLFVGGLLIAALGLFDDLRGANARQKFVVQIAVAIVMWVLEYRIRAISNPFGGHIELGVMSLPVTVLWFVAVMNAVNLIDGLDGLAGGIGLISVSTLLIMAVLDANPLGAFMCAGLAGSLVGFLFFNFNPARIFMGDTGSLFIGFVLAAFSISTLAKGATAVALAVPILALALPLVDTLLAISRRVRQKKKIFQADQEHIHHRLLKAGFSHRGAVLVLYAVAASFAALALVIRVASKPVAGAVMVGAALFLFVLLRYLASWHQAPRVLPGLADPFGADGLEARAALDAQAARLQQAQSRAELADELGILARVTRCLSVVLSDQETTLFVYERAATPHEAMRPLGSYTIPLASGRAGGPLLVELRFAREESGDLPVLLPWERVRPALATALERLGWPVLQEPLPALPARQPSVAVPAIDTKGPTGPTTGATAWGDARAKGA